MLLLTTTADFSSIYFAFSTKYPAINYKMIPQVLSFGSKWLLNKQFLQPDKGAVKNKLIGRCWSWQLVVFITCNCRSRAEISLYHSLMRLICSYITWCGWSSVFFAYVWPIFFLFFKLFLKCGNTHTNHRVLSRTASFYYLQYLPPMRLNSLYWTAGVVESSPISKQKKLLTLLLP